MASESQLIHSTGVALLGEIVWLTTITLLYGIFILLFSFSITRILRRRLTLASRAMAVITLIGFLLVSLHWAAEVSVVVIFVRSVLIVNLDLPLDERRALTNIAGHNPSFISTWTSGVLPILSDISVVWRAWVLFPERQWMVFGPALLVLSTIATTVAHIVIYSGTAPTTDPRYASNLWQVSVATSISSNAIATLLIAYKFWAHRKFVLENLGRRRNSRVQKILVILVESGVVYCALQLATLGFNNRETRELQGPAKYFAGQIFFAAYTAISGMYPTIIVALVNTQRSVVDTYSLDTISNPREIHVECGRRSASVGRISFALPPNQSVAMNVSSLAETEADSGLGDSTEKVYRLNDEEAVPGRHING